MLYCELIFHDESVAFSHCVSRSLIMNRWLVYWFLCDQYDLQFFISLMQWTQSDCEMFADHLPTSRINMMSSSLMSWVTYFFSIHLIRKQQMNCFCRNLNCKSVCFYLLNRIYCQNEIKNTHNMFNRCVFFVFFSGEGENTYIHTNMSPLNVWSLEIFRFSLENSW